MLVLLVLTSFEEGVPGDLIFNSQLRHHVWSPQDGDWGRSMVEHYKKIRVQDHRAGQDSTTTIPRILHLIWLGPRALPTTAPFDSWRHIHSDWKINVWREHDIHFELYNQEAFSFAMQQGNYGMASDVLRLELLYKYGGVYVDVDYLCISALDDLDHLDFYCGASHTGCIEVNNGLFGCRESNVMVKSLMKEIHTWFGQHQSPLSLISSFLSDTTTSLIVDRYGYLSTLGTETVDASVGTSIDEPWTARNVCHLSPQRVSSHAQYRSAC
jgi:hypothetical protein